MVRDDFSQGNASEYQADSTFTVLGVREETMMEPRLTDTEWDELVDLIAASPTGRMDEALKRLGGHASSIASTDSSATELRTPEDWLLHLASISSGEAFDRALLTELRRLSAH